MKRVLIAYSGGCDSTFLLKVVLDVLGKENVLAVTARSETYPKSELTQAKKTAKNLRAKILFINTDELKNKNFKNNPANRCYFCKKELFNKLKKIAKSKNIDFILDGTNTDDKFDYRPGYKAVIEAGAKSPLKEAGLSKKDIRKISKKMDLPTWDKPAAACLASRLPYNKKITKEKLIAVEKAEDYLRSLGFSHVRVRHHDDVARIECSSGGIEKLLNSKIRKKVVDKFKEIGFKYIAGDLQGYRTGSLNEALSEEK